MSSEPSHQQATNRAIEAVWRIEQPRLIAGLARYVGDLSLAEDIAQDALVSAFEHWPADGIPRNPAAWLMAAAKRRAIDRFRHRRMRSEKLLQVGADLETDQELAGADAEARLIAALDDDLGDNMLGLIFATCHPVLSPEARAALTLRIVGGLTTEEIARAFLAPEPTIAQRIVRAKKTLAGARVPFEVPRGAQRVERLPSVLEVVYLVYNEGYSATSGDDLLRPQLCHDAMRLGRVLAGLLPGEAEVLGLLALMELQASRLKARLAADGMPILLMDQDRSRWDRLLIGRGLDALKRAEALPGPRGPYFVQAAIAACHARALTPDSTDWGMIAALYGALGEMSPSPVIELNRAVAVSMARGPAAALPLLDVLAQDPALAGYHLLPAARADLLARMGRNAEARADFEKAAALTRNGRERALLMARAADAAAKARPSG
jgi:RNA polymerase sigma-70 factor (ECF subfamily)